MRCCVQSALIHLQSRRSRQLLCPLTWVQCASCLQLLASKLMAAAIVKAQRSWVWLHSSDESKQWFYCSSMVPMWRRQISMAALR